jgi:hypothetical protein
MWYLVFIIVLPILRIGSVRFSEKQNDLVNTLFKAGRFDITTVDYYKLVDGANRWLRRGQWFVLLFAFILSLFWAREALMSYAASWCGIPEIWQTPFCCLSRKLPSEMTLWPTLCRIVSSIHYCPTITLWYIGLFAFPIVLFTIFYWFFRALVWTGFVWKLTRHGQGLQLNIFHPDGVGGLGVFTESCWAWGIYVFTIGGVVVASYLNRIYITHETVHDWYMWFNFIAYIVFGTTAFLGPPLSMIKDLRKAKRKGQQYLSLQVSRLLGDFEKTINCLRPVNDATLPPHVSLQLNIWNANQQLYQHVQKMRILPIDVRTYGRLAFSYIGPLLTLLIPNLKEVWKFIGKAIS